MVFECSNFTFSHILRTKIPISVRIHDLYFYILEALEAKKIIKKLLIINIAFEVCVCV